MKNEMLPTLILSTLLSTLRVRGFISSSGGVLMHELRLASRHTENKVMLIRNPNNLRLLLNQERRTPLRPRGTSFERVAPLPNIPGEP